MEDDERLRYWDDTYFEYWKKRVEESQASATGKSNIVTNDHVVPGDKIYEDILDMAGIRDGMILDVGCAWGRMFGMYANRGLSIYGADISLKMIQEAKKSGIPQLAEVKQATAESLPYLDNFFDYLVCFGVFDATYQDKALGEFMRVVKRGGKVIVTGKNDNYLPDDEDAMLAEKGARRKGEPNYFTDVRYLIAQLAELGHAIERQLFFIRRGDFSKGKFVRNMPDRFYEYSLVIRKGSEARDFKPFYCNQSLVVGGTSI